MGRLVGLELHNFKSYKGTSLVGFGTSNFTSIIGPNGSGKSNMMDAISFVLGVRSSHLRSTQLKDLIYRGRIDDEQEGEENEEGEDDRNPSSAYVMAIYEKSNGEVLKLKREISPNGSSEYRINSQQVTASQYAEVLKEENILIKAKNFLVFQGDVEKIASQSSETLTTLIETISGSIEYKKEYDELADVREKAHDETALRNTKRRALKEELHQFKKQCREVDEFDQKTERLADAVQAKYLSKLYFNDKDLKDVQKALKGGRTEANKLKSRISKKEKELREFIRSGSNGHSGHRDLEDRIEKDRSILSEKRMELIPIEAETSQVSKKVVEYRKRLETLEEERERQSSSVEGTGSQLHKIEKAFENYSRQLTEEAKKRDESEDLDPRAVEDYRELREKFLMKGGHIESKLADLNDEKDSTVSRQEDFKSQRELIDTRLQKLELGKSDIKNKYEDIKSQINIITTSVSGKKRELNSLRASRDAIEQEEFVTNTTLKEVLLRLNELGSLKRENSREKRLRENCATLKRLFPGVHGLLSDVCRPKQRKYELAVSTAMGRSLDAIIVTNLSTAAECIEYLREQRAGSASFIPLDTIAAKPVGQQYRSIATTVRPAIDVVQYEPEYERAVQYACGDSLVCDSLEIAKAVRWERNIEVKVVALDGTLIQRSGIMTGGQTEKPNDKWDKAELNSLLSRKQELKGKLVELEQKKPSELLDRNLLNDLDRLENELPALKGSKQDLQRAINDADAEIRNQNRLLRELDEEAEKFKADIVNPLEERIQQTEVELELVQGTIYSDFCEKYGFHDIRHYEEKYGNQSRQTSKETAKFQKEIQRLRNRLQFEQGRLQEYDERTGKLREDEKKFALDSSELEAKKDKIESEIDHLESELEVCQEEYDTLQSRIKETADESDELKSELHDLKLESTSVNKKIGNAEETLDKIKMDKLGILRNCKLENVSIPLSSGNLQDIPLEDNDDDENEEEKATRLQSILEQTKANYSGLDKKYRQGSADAKEKEIEEEIANLRSELSGMNPNMNARERLDEASERLNEADAEFSNCKQHEREVVTRFEEIKKKRYDAFMKAFDHISNQIDPVYKELTRSRISPLGGSAYLTLEDEDEPYLAGIRYHAMPPMKRFRDMDLLSGGEKTVAALALLFAVHSFHPSPFFVLDEVDSALDNANVRRVANYINEHASPDFQFIVISLKNQLFEKSDALVGIYRELSINSSKTLTLDLRKYPDTEIA
ncbi:DEKNAAC103259 [Brettanomyces naardenensis]|uniref:Structural maintenance of chromosomes protein n=1 Tax=Brettanomyces naardenensis TaxID=13370 RepID=A0A448YMT6_BRENA|nr:DEKNAAC103259 [Brettanomyces naardenensis]